MAGIVAGFILLSLVYIAGVTLALFKEHGFRIKETFYDVVEAIQAIKQHKAKQGTKGS